MATKYGLDFPFRQSKIGDYVKMTISTDEEVDSVRKYIPNLEINEIKITNAELDPEQQSIVSEESDARLFRVSDASTKPYTAKIRIDYTTNNGAFGTSDFIIINI